MKRTYVVIINGCATSGKDEFVQNCIGKYENEDNIAIYNKSSVDTIKQILVDLGWDGEKTDSARDLIALLKSFWIKNGGGPTQEAVNTIIHYHSTIKENEDCNVIFYHIREPHEIDKLVKALDGMQFIGIHHITMLIGRYGAGSIATNLSDREENINNYNYDWVISNDGSKKELYDKACEFMEILLDGGCC